MYSKKLKVILFGSILMGVNVNLQASALPKLGLSFNGLTHECDVASIVYGVSGFKVNKVYIDTCQNLDVNLLLNVYKVTKDQAEKSNKAILTYVNSLDESAAPLFFLVDGVEGQFDANKNLMQFTLAKPSAITPIPTTTPTMVVTPTPIATRPPAAGFEPLPPVDGGSIAQPTPSVTLAPATTATPTPPQSNNSYVLINAQSNGETPLPGSTGKTIYDQVYALRFSFKEITGRLKDSEISIQTVTRDIMTREDDKYRKFDITVSETPGYIEAWDPVAEKVEYSNLLDDKGNVQFYPDGSPIQYASKVPDEIHPCSRHWVSGGAELTIYGKQVAEGSAPASSSQCPLTPGKEYYINVRAAAPGCRDEKSNTVPGICAVKVSTNVPASVQ
ncbi:MAG: hypothetical protein ABL903_14730 [Methylococcales bacterium]